MNATIIALDPRDMAIAMMAATIYSQQNYPDVDRSVREATQLWEAVYQQGQARRESEVAQGQECGCPRCVQARQEVL